MRIATRSSRGEANPGSSTLVVPASRAFVSQAAVRAGHHKGQPRPPRRRLPASSHSITSVRVRPHHYYRRAPRCRRRDLGTLLIDAACARLRKMTAFMVGVEFAVNNHSRWRFMTSTDSSGSSFGALLRPRCGRHLHDQAPVRVKWLGYFLDSLPQFTYETLHCLRNFPWASLSRRSGLRLGNLAQSIARATETFLVRGIPGS